MPVPRRIHVHIVHMMMHAAHDAIHSLVVTGIGRVTVLESSLVSGVFVGRGWGRGGWGGVVEVARARSIDGMMVHWNVRRVPATAQTPVGNVHAILRTVLCNIIK